MKYALDISAAEKRYSEIDLVLRTRPERSWTTEAILLHLVNAVPHPKAGEEWSKDQFNKDIRHMRDLDAPIVCHPRLYTYSYDQKAYKEEHDGQEFDWKKVGYDPQIFHALHFARAILKQYEGLPAIDDIIELTKEIEKQNTREGDSLPLVPVHFSPGSQHHVKPEIWATVLKGATEKKAIKITYSGWDGQPTNKPRVIDAYAVVRLKSDWYVIGTKDVKSDSLRQYKMRRILTAEVTEAHSGVLSFNIDDLLYYTFENFIGSPGQHEFVEIRVAKRIAMLAIEETSHPEQGIKPHGNGDVTLRFPVSKSGKDQYYDIKRWVLQWGSEAEVITPLKLKEQVQEEIRKMVK